MVISEYVLEEMKLRSVFLGLDIGVNMVYILNMSLTSSWKETAKGKGVTLGLVTVFFNNLRESYAKDHQNGNIVPLSRDGREDRGAYERGEKNQKRAFPTGLKDVYRGLGMEEDLPLRGDESEAKRHHRTPGRGYHRCPQEMRFKSQK